jgi:hypothetical protein
MSEDPITFKANGHPTIKLFEDRVSIKAIDYGIFRDFKLTEVKSIDFPRPYENSLLGFLYETHSFWRKYRAKDDYVLKIKLKNGEHWDYKTIYNYDPAFKNLIEALKSRLKE